MCIFSQPWRICLRNQAKKTNTQASLSVGFTLGFAGGKLYFLSSNNSRIGSPVAPLGRPMFSRKESVGAISVICCLL